MKHKLIQTSAIASMLIFAGGMTSQSALAELDGSFSEEIDSELTATTLIDEEYEALLSVEANRDQIVAEIVALFTPQMEGDVSQLEGLLKHADAEQLLASREAQNIDELNIILTGSDAASGDLDGALTVGDTYQDYSFTPITPCRIVDTRRVGGVFYPGQVRPYYVYGSLGSQGGTSCSSPVGEPRGVMLNITVVPVSGAGNVVAYPYNVAAPGSSLVNYKTGVQNIANAASIKTGYLLGHEINVKNNGGYAHLIIDVLGYYTNPETPTQISYTGGDELQTISSAVTTVKSMSVYTPKSAYCVVNASGFYEFDGAGFDKLQCSISSDTNINYSRSIYGSDEGSSTNSSMPFAATGGFYKSAGSTTYSLVCRSVSGVTKVGDSTLTAICTPN